MNDFNLKNRWDQPSKSLPIIFIGAGGIIRNAHLPAYNKLNLNIAGVYDLNLETAKTLAKDFNIPNVYENLDDAPELMNEDPYGEGWIVKMKLENMDAVSGLLSPKDYRSEIGE